MKTSEIRLRLVENNDISFLYRLLSRRSKIYNISHKKMPTFDEHKKFVKSNPYSKWFIVMLSNKKIGSIYLTNLNEIGIHLKKEFDTIKIKDNILKIIIKQNPKKRLLVNINPQNKKLIDFFTKRGFNLIQFSYELNLENCDDKKN